MTSRSPIPAALAALALLAFGAAVRAQEDAARGQTEAAGEPTVQAAATFRLPLPGAGFNGRDDEQGNTEIGAVVGGATSPLDPKQGSLMDNSGRVPQDVVSADFNRDGLADLAIAFAFDDAVRWYYGRGDGTFSFQGKAEVGVHPGSLNDLPRALLAHDFDGDGFTDLAVLCSGNPGPPQPTEPSLGILYGDPVGGFEPFRPVAMAPDLAPAPAFSVALAAGTIDADDRLDLVVGHFDSNQVSVILHGGRRRWKTPLLIPVATAGEGPTAFSIADFDFDGATDLVLANRKDLQLWRGNGTGEFPWKATFADGADFTVVAAADFDEDGLRDLAALDGSGQSADLYMGLHADGSTERVLALPLVDNASFPAGQGPADLVLYDANLDGRDDLALIYLVSGGGSLLLSQPRAAVPQEADAPLPLRFHHGFSTAQKPRSIIAADLNRDRMKDLAVIHEGDSSVGSNQDLVVELNALKPYQAERLIPQSSSVPGRQLAAYLGRPRGLGWDPVRSALWTLDREERRLVRLSPESHVQFSVSLKALSANPPVDPTDLAVDGDGYLWITDRLSASVFRFRPGMGTDSLKRVFSTTGVGLLRPSGIAVDHDADRLLISDERRPVIMSFSLTGKLKNIYTITTGRPALDLAWDGAAEEPPAHGRLWAALGDLESEPPDLDSQPWPGQIVVLGLDDEQGEAAPAAQVTLGAVGDALSPTFLRSVAVDRMKWGERAGYRLGALTDSGTLMLAHVGIDENAPSSPGSLGPGDPTIIASIEGIWELSLLRNVRSIARGSEGAVLLADGGPMATLVVVGPGDEVLQARMLNEPAPRPVRIEGLSAGPGRIYVLDGLHEEIRAYETDGAFVSALGGEALEGRRPRGLHFEPATSHFFVGTAGRLIELDSDGTWVRECRTPTTAAPGSISSGQRPGEVMLFSPSRNQFYYCDLGETPSLRKTLVATQWLPSRFAPNAAALGTQANELVMAGSGEPTLLRLKLGLPLASAGNVWSLYR